MKSVITSAYYMQNIHYETCAQLSTNQPLLLMPLYGIGNDMIYDDSYFFMVSFTRNLKRPRLKLRYKYP